MQTLHFDRNNTAQSPSLLVNLKHTTRGSAPLPKRKDELIMAVCDAAIDLLSILFGVDGAELRSATRAKKDIARVRQLGMYALNVALGMKMGEIAQGFSRDRSTVIYACHVIEDMRDDPDFDRVVCRVEALFAISFQFVAVGKNAEMAPVSTPQC